MAKTTKKKSATITTSSTAEYFAKNLQQVGFSSPSKAVLTTIKEALDNSLDACEEHGILPNIHVTVKKIGKGTLRNTDRIRIEIEDNGPGLTLTQVPMVFGEYLASSKFGRGRCSRGQQGIGISAATTWAVQTTATGAKVITKTSDTRKALSCIVVTDLKKNKGLLKEKEMINWNVESGTKVSFDIDGRLQLNGEGGVLAYLRGSILLNPHLSLSYELPEIPKVSIDRVSTILPQIPEACPPHPHTMKLGEFISHARLFGKSSLKEWLQKGFTRIGPQELLQIITLTKLPKNTLEKAVSSLDNSDFEKIYGALQEQDLKPPSTQSVMAVGEEALSLSIQRLGEIDFFSVVSRKPAICDFKPVQVEVAIARQKQKNSGDSEEAINVLRFANRVPLQFDKASCAIVKAITSINWKAYGLKQTKGALPQGPYIIAVSVISPFIKFKNASKETIDASDELVEEIRKALMKSGQQVSRHLNKENKERELEAKTQHVEKFAPILLETLCNILKASPGRKEKATKGLEKILRNENAKAQIDFANAEEKLRGHLAKQKHHIEAFLQEDDILRKLEREQQAALQEKEEAEAKSANAEEDAKKKAKKTNKKAKK